MAPGVIADQVAGLEDAPCQIPFGFDEVADHEKGGANIVFGQDIEQARSPRGVRAIIVGESELARTARRNEGAAEELGAGPSGGVGVPADANSGCAGETDSTVNTDCQMRKHCC